VGLSSDPDARARQEANLVPAPPAPEGNARAEKHGGYRPIPRADLSADMQVFYAAFVSVVPARSSVDPDQVAPADEAAVEVCARAFQRWRRVGAWVEEHGEIDEEAGAERPAARFELACERALHRALDALGLTPKSRLRLGLRLMQAAADLSTAMSEQDPERRRELMRQAGVDVDDLGDDES
jgi:Phage terminase, small subunit